MELKMIERLIDSVIIIDHLNGIKNATQFMLELDPQKTAISVITRAEILTGIDRDEQATVIQLLDHYNLFIIDKPIADLAADLRRDHGWKLPDSFQAALAKHHKTQLTTRNSKDFDPAKFDFVEIPYNL